MPTRSRWLTLLSALALLGAVPLACGGSAGEDASHPRPETSSSSKCRDFEQDVERYWSSSTRTEVRAGILSAGGSTAEQTAERVVTKMDSITRGWVMMQESVCKDCLERGLLSKEAYAQISACLRSALVGQRMLATTLTSPNAQLVQQADSAIARIASDLNECQREAVYTNYNAHAEVESSVRTRLAEAAVLKDLGALEAAREAATDAGRLASEAKSPALSVDAAVMQSRVAFDLGDHRQAEALAQRAATEATSSKYGLGQAAAWRIIGLIRLSAGANSAAEKYITDALNIRKELLGAQSEETAISLGDLGMVRLLGNRPAEALKHFEAKLAILEPKLGASGPRTLQAMLQVAHAYAALGQGETALRWYTKVSRLCQESYGMNHPIWADAAASGARVAVEMGRLDVASLTLKLVLKVRTELYGAEHPDTVWARDALTQLCHERGFKPACSTTIDPSESQQLKRR